MRCRQATDPLPVYEEVDYQISFLQDKTHPIMNRYFIVESGRIVRDF